MDVRDVVRRDKRCLLRFNDPQGPVETLPNTPSVSDTTAAFNFELNYVLAPGGLQAQLKITFQFKSFF